MDNTFLIVQILNTSALRLEGKQMSLEEQAKMASILRAVVKEMQRGGSI